MSKSVVPNVVILGRPNVGKSALFNRLISRRKALVDAVYGVTRDYISQPLEWNGLQFLLSDSAGVTFQDDDFQNKIFAQIQKALEIADLILFTVDSNITSLDRDVSDMIRQSGKKTLLVVNKIDSISQEWNDTAPFSLGWDDVHKVSAISGLGTGDLLDRIVEMLPVSSKRIEESSISLAIVGRPNVGKSTLLNNILGDQRVIVDDKPGTTRDAVDAVFRFDGRVIRVTDTAGILKRQQGLDYYSSLRSLDAIKHSDVVLILVDCLQGIGKIEKTIAGEALKEFKGIVILINKWDAFQDKDSKSAEKFKEKLYDDIPFIKYCPMLFISALEGKNIQKAISQAVSVSESRSKRISTSDLNKFFQDTFNYSPENSLSKGGFMYISQVGVEPPHFILFHKKAERITKNKETQIMNLIRRHFGFEGVPIKLSVKESK